MWRVELHSTDDDDDDDDDDKRINYEEQQFKGLKD
jgi:hypothetical protein